MASFLANRLCVPFGSHSSSGCCPSHETPQLWVQSDNLYWFSAHLILAVQHFWEVHFYSSNMFCGCSEFSIAGFGFCCHWTIPGSFVLKVWLILSFLLLYLCVLVNFSIYRILWIKEILCSDLDFLIFRHQFHTIQRSLLLLLCFLVSHLHNHLIQIPLFHKN